VLALRLDKAAASVAAIDSSYLLQKEWIVYGLEPPSPLFTFALVFVSSIFWLLIVASFQG
jgi:hypothetical protein